MMLCQHPDMGERVAIIGAGVGGLVSASLLAARGMDVTVFEAAPQVGGKLRAIGGIDAGPTVFTLRHVFDEILDEIGASGLDAILKPAATLAQHHWPDGTSLALHADPQASEAAIATFAGPAAVAGYRAFRAEAKRLFDALDRPFMRGTKTDPFTLAWRMGASGLRDWATLSPYTSLWNALGRYFPDPRLRQLFGRYATYCGSSPFRTPATLMLIAHAEAQGVWLVDGGMARLATLLESAAKAKGARIRTNAAVSRIDTDFGRAAGLTLASGERIIADRIIMNADPAALADGRFGNRAGAGVSPAHRSLSAVVGLVTGQLSGHVPARHNVAFSRDYSAEFDALRSGRLAERPTIYLCAQDRECGPAPPDEERFQLIMNAPANGDSYPYTPEEKDRCRTLMLESLAASGLKLQPRAFALLTPNDFEAMNPSTGGALYGRASHGWAASFRRQGARTAIPGLYCAGGSCHPGAGVPMAALSARLACDTLLSDLASTVRSRRAATAGGMSTPSAETAVTG
jgi:1-hydroxycarotenoid 3,4-desaturase